MEDTKILAITGTSGSGKTTLSFKIAKELERQDKEVCIVSFDTLSPLSAIKENYSEYNVSIGYMLTKETNTTQRDIYTNMIPITKKISIASYVYGDTKDKYPKIINSRVRDYIELLSGMVDYIIIDAGTNIIEPETRQALKMANKILCVLESNYKSVAYYKTFLELLGRIDIDNNNIIYLFNKLLYETNFKKYQLDIGIKFYSELPYLEEIVRNVNEPLKYLEKRTHETEKYRRLFKILIKNLYNIEFEEELLESKIEIKEQKKIIKENVINTQIEEKISKLKNKDVYDKDDNYIDINKDYKNEKPKSKKGSLFNIFSKPKKENAIVIPKYYDEGDEF